MFRSFENMKVYLLIPYVISLCNIEVIVFAKKSYKFVCLLLLSYDGVKKVLVSIY